MADGGSQYLSISALTSLLQETVEEMFPVVYFRGEIFELSRPQSGHIYFTLKDENAQVSAVMWKAQAQFLKFQLKPGQEVLCQGKVTVYPKAGRLQIIVHRIQPFKEGVLQQRFFELKKKLGDEGLFAEERKKTLPFLPAAVGVVTSASGAVIHDIMVKIRERMPSMKVYLVDVRVQGEGAAGEIAEAVGLLNRCDLVDVILVARGGGSLEDLWAFNEEAVVRAVAASRLPVISAVGHEVDISLCDLAADRRAPTPTAAAEMVVPNRNDLQRVLDALECRLTDTGRWLQPRMQYIDELGVRLERAMQQASTRRLMLLENAKGKLREIEPGRLLALLSERLRSRAEMLGRVSEGAVGKKRNALSIARSRLAALSPRKVLERGFAVVQSGTGVVTSADELSAQEEVRILLASGGARAVIEGLFNNWNDTLRRK